MVGQMAKGLTRETSFSRNDCDGEGTPEPFGTAVRFKRINI